MSSRKRLTIGPLFTGFVDDAAVFPPGNAPIATAIADHRHHRTAWYQSLVGPLLLPAGMLDDLPNHLDTDEQFRIGVIADTGVDAAAAAIARLPGTVAVHQIEARTPDAASVDALAQFTTETGIRGYAEIPIADPTPHLPRLAEAGLTPKFRTGGLTADMFPSPTALAHAITACAAAGVDFKLTAGLHRALRYTDPRTGFHHHGFGNILAAAALADAGGSVPEVASLLEITETDPVRYSLRGMLANPRRLWVGFGSCSIAEPLDDLIEWSLVTEES